MKWSRASAFCAGVGAEQYAMFGFDCLVWWLIGSVTFCSKRVVDDGRSEEYVGPRSPAMSKCVVFLLLFQQ